MPELDVPIEPLALIELIAGAIRDELGEEIDAYPGLRDPARADPMNRAFRAVARTILARAVDAGLLPDVLSATLRASVRHRLNTEGWDEDQINVLIEQESGSPDDWLVFLLLSSRTQIEPLLGHDP